MPLDLFAEEKKAPLDLFGKEQAKPKSTNILDLLKSMPVIEEPGTNLNISDKALPALAGEVAPYSKAIGATLGARGGIPGVALGYLAGGQAEPLLEAYAKGTPVPTGEEQASRVLEQSPEAGITGLMGPVSGKLIQTGGQWLGPKLRAGAEKLYSGSIKMPLYRKWTKVRGPEETSKVKEATNIGLEKEIPPSDYGRAKTAFVKDEAKRKIDDIVENIGTSEQPLDNIVWNGLQKAIKRAESGEAKQEELDAIINWASKYVEGKARIPTGKELEKFKVELYKRSNYDKMSGKADELKEVMRKGVAHEMRLQLERMNPAIKEANREWAAANDLEEALERALPRMNNNAVFSLGTKVMIGRESIPLAILNQTLGHPAIKSRMAFILNRASKETGTTASELIKRTSPFIGGIMTE